MDNVISAIKRQNSRGKNIHLFARYSANQFTVHCFDGYHSAALHPIFSVTKAITCAAVLTLAERACISLDEPLAQRLNLAFENPLAKQLTIRQFANMTTGFAWSEISTFGQPHNLFDQFVESDNPLQFLFARPIDASQPFCYNSAVSHALSYWAETVSGQPFDTLIEQLFFEPLSIEHYSWQRDAKGKVFGGHGLELRGIDFVKLMPLFGEGKYAGRQLLSADVLATLHSSAVVPDAYYRGYGCGLWHGDINRNRFIAAFGNAGQRIYHFPDLAVSYAFLGDTKPEFGTQEALLKKLFTG